jgi:hypothetical protein
MSVKSAFIHFLAALCLIAGIPPAQAGSTNRLVGAWHTLVNRTASPHRPVLFLFHDDGTLQYVSNANIHIPATATPEVFFGRTGGVGVYRKIPGKANMFKGYTEELLYDQVGNGKGRVLAEFTFKLSKNGADLSGDFKFRFTSYIPGDLAPADAITGEKEELVDNGQLGLIKGYRVTQSCFFTGGAKPCYEGPTSMIKQ